MTRIYTADITTGTTGLQIQLQRPGRIKQLLFSGWGAAAGKSELSRSPSTSIGTAQPDPAAVLARVDLGSGAPMQLAFDCDIPVQTLDRVYCYMSGAGNLGTWSICVQER